METTTGVYAVLNEVNGKIYIGSTARGFNERWSQHKHRNSTCRALKSALKKYGADKFTFHILEHVNVDGLALGDARKLLIQAEQEWIDLVNPFGENGYNMLPKAYSHLGAKRSEATKAALSKALKGKKHPAWRVEKNRQAHIGKTMPVDAKEKIRLAMLGRISPMKGRKQSEESKARIKAWSDANKEKLSRPMTDSVRAKLSLSLKGRKAWNKGIPLSETTKAKLSAAKLGTPSPRKGVHLSEKTKEKIRKKVLGFKHTAEAREKIRAAALRQWQDKKGKGENFNG